MTGSIWFKLCCALLLLLIATLPGNARADIYKCTKGGAVTYQDSPCTGANVQATQVDTPGSSHFVGCFGAVSNNRYGASIEVRANGAGTYQMIDEHNPLSSGITLRAATDEELRAVSQGLHIHIIEGLSRDTGRSTLVNVYSIRARHYIVTSSPGSTAISPSSLYGIYQGIGSEGQPVTLLYRGGGEPQTVMKGACPTY
nr:DUF4124 domain-containing protein [Dyella sp. 2HG41-7]